MIVRVGFANDHTGATHKYVIVGQMVGGAYVVRPFVMLTRPDGSRFLAESEVQITPELRDIHTEEVPKCL